VSESRLLTGDTWSVDDETFRCESLGELLEDHDELVAGSTVYRGKAVRPDPATYIDTKHIIEMIGERAWDDCGEAAEDWPAIPSLAEHELQTLLKAWATKHLSPTPFYRVENVVEYTITEADMEGHRE
jgi:hypothetical protein